MDALERFLWSKNIRGYEAQCLPWSMLPQLAIFGAVVAKNTGESEPYISHPAVDEPCLTFPNDREVFRTIMTSRPPLSAAEGPREYREIRHIGETGKKPSKWHDLPIGIARLSKTRNAIGPTLNTTSMPVVRIRIRCSEGPKCRVRSAVGRFGRHDVILWSSFGYAHLTS